MKVGFTGAQKGLTRIQRFMLRTELERNWFSEAHHGDCIGADSEFHDLIREIHPRESTPTTLISVHPPENPTKRAFKKGDFVQPEAPYLARNHELVDDVDVLIACPSGPEKLRSGTWATVRYARRSGIPIILIYPDGAIETELK